MGLGAGHYHDIYGAAYKELEKELGIVLSEHTQDFKNKAELITDRGWWKRLESIMERMRKSAVAERAYKTL